MQGWGIVLTAIAYLLFLFVVASYGDRRRTGKAARRSRPTIYSLSLAVYCTSWTFFGSVGLAATSGLDFLAIYVGPILIVTVASPIFSHVISVAKSERITSIADFIASRYGKSTAAGALAAFIAVVGTVPYIALQLKAISTSVDTMVGQYQPLGLVEGLPLDTAFFVSLLLALFAVLFGTRHADATEHQDGLMLAVAAETIVKLVAFVAVGLFVTFYLFDGIDDIANQASASLYVDNTFKGGINPAKFAIFTLLSFCAFMLLPRQFHVGVVENHSQEELRTARWMFPLYLVLINLFVVPVALGGMLQFGSSIDPDKFVLALPLGNNAPSLSLLVFIGGFSAATAMVIVACVALAIMLSNNIILPLVLKRQPRFSAGDRNMAPLLLKIRRSSIFCIMVMAYAYFKIAGDSAALASIGLLSFAAVAQFAPSFFGGLFWRRANARGALWGMAAGFAMWFYTLLLPTLIGPGAEFLQTGPFGTVWLRPQALFGIEADPLNHGVLFSLGVNLLVWALASLSRESRAVERMQANAFWYFGRHPGSAVSYTGHSATVGEVQAKVANYLGKERSDRAFDLHAQNTHRNFDPRELADDGLLHFAEQLLASAIGAASSRLVLSLMTQKHGRPSTETTLQLLDDASEALQQNRELLQTAIDQVEQGISVFDSEFKLSSWNRQFREMLHLPTELGQAGTSLAKIAEAISIRCDWPRRGTRDFAKRLLELDQPWQMTHLSSGRIIEIHTKPMPVGGHVISWHDVTERENASRVLQTANETLEKRVEERTAELMQLNDDLARAREAAETANIGKTKFLAAVGHDILQPLNAARLYASSLMEKLSDQPIRSLAANVDDSLESVEEIMGTVLAISRLDSGVLTPNNTNFTVETLFQRLEVEFNPMASTKGLELKFIPNDFAVRSDFNLLRRLLQNLISNAIKYTDYGSVTVDARLKRNKLIFDVIDTGHGIAEEDHEAAFEEFNRLERGISTTTGLGLGLSIVKRLAATLDHELEFKSKLGHGTHFSVHVPLARGVVETHHSNNKSGADSSDLTGLQVVCVDNEPRILDGMERLLGGWGCEVLSFESLSALRDDIDELTPALVIADYHLEEETGLDVVAAMREHFGTELVAIIITADRSAEIRDAIKAADISLLTKPLKPAALRAILARQMQVKRSQQTAEPAE